MKNRLHIGILDPGHGWTIALRQIGVPYEPVHRLGALSAASHAVLIVNRHLSDDDHALVEAYLSEGGAVLDAGFFLSAKGLPRRVRRVMPDQSAGASFAGVGCVDLFRWTRSHRGARHVGNTVYLGEHGGGPVAHFGFDVESCMLDTRTARKAFDSPSGKFPNEIVALVSKGTIRAVIERTLRWLCHRRGLPFVHRWYFPENLPTVFCYRVDSDYGTERQCRDLYAVAARYDMRLTWFLHVGAHEQWLRSLHGFRNQEFAVHCYRHKTFRGFGENLANITEARSLLDAAKIPYEGFAAPNGFWNPALASVLEQCGFRYSSEFSLCHDDLPFHPSVRGRFSSVLQVPIHPVCIGSLIRTKDSARQMMDYHRHIVAGKAAAGEPVILYHHPPHEHWDVVADTFAFVRELGIRNMTFGEYAQWWLRREATVFAVDYSQGSFGVARSNDDASVRLRAVMPDGDVGFIGSAGDLPLKDIAWKKLSESSPYQNDARCPRRNLFGLIQNSIEDFNARIRQ